MPTERDDLRACPPEDHSGGALLALLLADALIWVVAVVAVLLWLR